MTMKLFRKYPKLHIWLLVDLLLLGLFVLTRGNRTMMNALTTHFTEPLKRGITRLTYSVSFSVAEVVYITAILVGVLLLPCAVRALVQSRKKWLSSRVWSRRRC